MRIVALAVCVITAFVMSLFMVHTVPPWTVAVCAVVFIAAFWLGRRMEPGWPLMMFIAAAWLSLTHLVVVLLAVTLPWILGRVAQQQAALAASHVEAAHLRERTRIAHEVHDTLGHELSLIALQAGALEMNLPAEHQAAAAQLRVAASDATERLADLVFLLRDGDPLTVVDLRDLVDRAVASGLRVEFSVTGGIPSTVERAVHRVVQESLTNAAKHAPKSLLALKVTTADDTTVVEARNDLGLRRGAGSRLGLIALRERVRLAGGTLRTSRDDGKFELVATLPHTGET
ncbi:sensor histidine kinase [Lentzea aerocolonigenes]|nr:histidine kinase [Lentzea aerocolonigenes]